MKKSDLSVLFVGKTDDAHCAKALQFCERNFNSVQAHLGVWGTPLPQAARTWKGDFIVSYLSRWIIREPILRNAKYSALNFHPGSPDYPGIGCNNFALYEDAKEYGTTCHIMESKVDVGEIIAVKRFPVFPSDNVESLLTRTYDYQLVLFYEILEIILQNKPLPQTNERWTRDPVGRDKLNELATIAPEMEQDEVRRRIRATSFGPWKPSVSIGEFTFDLKIGT